MAVNYNFEMGNNKKKMNETKGMFRLEIDIT